MAEVGGHRPTILLTASLSPGAVGPRGARSRRLLPAFDEAGYEVIGVTVDADRMFPAAPGPRWRRVRATVVRMARALLPLTDHQIARSLAIYRKLRKLPRPPGLVAIYAIGFPFSALVLGARLSRIWGVPLIADMGDPWPRRGPAEYLLERWTLGRASTLVVPTERMAAVYRRRRRAGYRVVVAPNGADRVRSVRNRTRPLFLHVGTLSHLRIDPGPAFRALASMERDGLIEFASYGSTWTSLPPDVARHHQGPIATERAGHLLAQSSAALILGNRSPIGLPSKTMQVVRSDVWALFVTEHESELGAEMVVDTAHGEVVSENSEAAICEAALSILTREERGERPEPTDGFSWEETLAILIQVVDDTTAPGEQSRPAAEAAQPIGA